MSETADRTNEPLHDANQLDARSFKLRFRVRREMLYDERRAAFFERWAGVAVMTALLGSSAPVVALLGALPQWAGALGGFVSAVSLVINAVGRLSVKGADHRVRQRGLRRLAGRLGPLRNFDDAEYAAFLREYNALLADAPPTKELLAMECHNSTLLFYGHPVLAADYDWWHRLTKNCFSWDGPVRRNLNAAS